MWRKLLTLSACSAMLVAGCTSDDDGVSRGTSAPAMTPAAADTTTGATTETTNGETDTPGSSPSTTVVESTTTIAPQPPIDLSSIDIGDPELVTGTLANGLTYYVRHNDNPGGSVQLRLAIRAGSGREADDQSGVAHFLEHMLFNGTASFPENELIDVLRNSGARFGADVNAYTSYDETVYELSVPAKDGGAALATAMQVMQEWLSAATIDPNEVVKERGVVLDEYRSRQESSSGRLRVGFQDLFLAGSVYATRSPIGTTAAIEAMTPELLRRFYDDWYRPDNASIAIIGDIEPAFVEAQIADRFGPLQARAAAPAADPLTVTPSVEPRPALLLDPDVVSATVEFSLPTRAVGSGLEASPQVTADSLVFTMISNRLSDDAVTAVVPFDAARVDGNSFVDSLDAPSIVIDAKPGQTTEAMQALLDEFERVRRYGFAEVELQRAISGFRSQTVNWYASRDTRQDNDFADSYVETFLRGAPILTEQARFDASVLVLDAMTIERVNERFQQRWAASAPHVVVVGPKGDEANLPTVDQIGVAIAAAANRDIVDRRAPEPVAGPLMAVPEPVEETSTQALTPFPNVLIDDPTQITFANGVTVLFQRTGISNGDVVLRAESHGGLSLVAADDIVDARVAAEVVTSGGVGSFNQAQLAQLTAASSAVLSPSIGFSDDAFAGSASTIDLETLLQLVNQYMTVPRFDPVALENVVTDIRAAADDPLANQGIAAYDALSTAKYGDDARFRYLLTAADADGMDLAGIERVWRANFANAAGWTFAITGDFDLATATDLARRYLGTLVNTGPDARPVEIIPPPPPGIVAVDILAGTGNRATLVRTYTGTIAQNVDSLVVADIATEIVSTRLSNRIREELGESYSPYAAFSLNPSPTGGDAWLNLDIEVSTAPDQVGIVSSVVTEEIARLAAQGATQSEIAAAKAVVEEQYYIYNEEIANVLIGTAIGVGQTAADYNDRYESLFTLRNNAVNAFLALPAGYNAYVEVGATPR